MPPRPEPSHPVSELERERERVGVVKAAGLLRLPPPLLLLLLLARSGWRSHDDADAADRSQEGEPSASHVGAPICTRYTAQRRLQSSTSASHEAEPAILDEDGRMELRQALTSRLSCSASAVPPPAFTPGRRRPI